MRPAAAPQLDTERLILRGMAATDVDPLHALWTDPEIHRFISGRAFTPQEIWFRVLRSIGHWQLLGFGYWVVTDRATGKVIGEMGFGDFHRADLPELVERPEIGWVLAPASQGKGLAREALAVIQAWGDHHVAAAETACIISTENTRSVKLASALGFTPLATRVLADGPVDIYTRQAKKAQNIF